MIEINKKWAIGADSLNFILYHKSIPMVRGSLLVLLEVFAR